MKARAEVRVRGLGFGLGLGLGLRLGLRLGPGLVLVHLPQSRTLTEVRG